MIRFRYMWMIAVAGMLTASCQRDQILDEDMDMGSITTLIDQNTVILDTLVLTGPVRSNGQVQFTVNGPVAALRPGDCFIYPGSFGLYGRILSTFATQETLLIRYQKVGIDALFTSVSLKNHMLDQSAAQTVRLEGSSWIGDTLMLNQYAFFTGMIEGNPLMINFQEGKLFAREQFKQELVINRIASNHLRRFGMDVIYEQEFNAVVRFTTFGPIDGKDSIRISSRLFGPFYEGPMPVFYQVDHYVNFEVHFIRDTIVILDFAIKEKGELQSTYSFWEGWKINQRISEYQVSYDTVLAPRLSNHLVKLSFSRSITPLFAGESSHRFIQESGVELKNFIELPEWQREKRIFTNASAVRTGSALGEIDPVALSAGETTFYRTVLNGVHNNTPPVAIFKITPPSGLTTTNFEFDASECTDLETKTDNLEVRWDFDGDNHYDTEFSTTKTIFQVFPVPGIYQVVMEVRDEGGLTTRATKSLTVELSHSAPTAFFTVTPESGRTNNYFTFDASGSWDADDLAEMLKVRWDFNGDGTWDTQFSTTKFAVWVYPEPGNYVAKLEVKDTEGLTGSTSKMVRVAPANIKPTAFFTVSPESGTIETVFRFDASLSSDPEDALELLQVRWDWNNDGAWDTEYRIEKTINKRFDVAGDYLVVLEVLDTEGFSNTFSQTVRVSNPNTPPKADFTITPSVGTVETLFLFDASISSDLEDQVEELQVRWDWDNDDVWDTDYTTEKTATRKFAQPGTYIVKVQVKDTGGLIAQKARLVTVE